MAIAIDKIEPQLLKAIEKKAKNENTSEEEILTKLIKEGLGLEKNENETTEEKIKRLSNGKASLVNKNTYNPNPSENELNSIVNIAKAPKGFNPVKAIYEIRKGKF